MVFYKSVRDIHPGEEMLLYAREAVYPELELESLARRNLADQTSYSCPNCGEVFRSKVAVRRHQSYTCTNTVSPYTALKQKMGISVPHSLFSPPPNFLLDTGNNNNNNNNNHNHNNNSGINFGSTLGGSAGAGIFSGINSFSGVGNSNGLSLNKNTNNNNSNNNDLMKMNDNDDDRRFMDGDDSDGNKSDENSDSFQDPIETGNGGEYKCDECPKSFQWKANLQRHQALHDADRKFPCENCDKIFTDPSNLQRHIRSQHVGARCHACSECGKTFATSSGLKQHQHIHSSIKPFQCEVCLKAYTQFSNLCRHKRMHADCRQQIKCKDCGQAFSTVTSLSKHKRFCEGAMRNGMRSIYPSPDKLSPLSLTPRNHTSHLQPSPMFPNIYAAAAAASRPQFPFAHYPAFSAFTGLLPPGIPSMLANSPVSPSSVLKLGVTNSPSSSFLMSPNKKLPLSPDSSGISPRDSSHLESESISESKLKVASEDSNHSYNSFHDDADINSENGSENGEERGLKRKFEFSENDLTPSGDQSPVERVSKSPRSNVDSISPCPSEQRQNASTPKEQTISIAPPGFTQFRPQSPIVSSIVKAPKIIPIVPSPIKQETPFDLSGKIAIKNNSFKSPKEEPRKSNSTSPSSESSSKIRTSPSRDEAPLDLSKKQDSNPILQVTSPERKTHIYGSELSEPITPAISSCPPVSIPLSSISSTPSSLIAPSLSDIPLSMVEPKTSTSLAGHYPYPFMMGSLFHNISEDMKLQREMAAKFSNPFTRFPMHGPTAFPGLHSHQYNMLSRQNLDKVLNPLIKMEKPPEFSSHHHPHPHHRQQHPHSHHPFAPGATKNKERYTCKYCGKVFPRSANLTRHLRTHTGEQPYRCKYCERSFSISSNLQRHVRNIHNKEKPFKCQLCERCFGQQTNLDRHLKKHEQDGQQFVDSPSNELEGKEDSYFSEIRNFIGEQGNNSDYIIDDKKDDFDCDDEEINVDNEIDDADNIIDSEHLDDEDEEMDEDIEVSDDDILGEDGSLTAHKLDVVESEPLSELLKSGPVEQGESNVLESTCDKDNRVDDSLVSNEQPRELENAEIDV